jgi:hypothetical protein
LHRASGYRAPTGCGRRRGRRFDPVEQFITIIIGYT